MSLQKQNGKRNLLNNALYPIDNALYPIDEKDEKDEEDEEYEKDNKNEDNPDKYTYVEVNYDNIMILPFIIKLDKPIKEGILSGFVIENGKETTRHKIIDTNNSNITYNGLVDDFKLPSGGKTTKNHQKTTKKTPKKHQKTTKKTPKNHQKPPKTTKNHQKNTKKPPKTTKNHQKPPKTTKKTPKNHQKTQTPI